MELARIGPAPPASHAGVQGLVGLAGAGVLVVGALALGAESWRYGALLVTGALLGVSLYHAAFGFTSAYRRAIVERDVVGVIAQLVMLGLAMLLFTPLLMARDLFGYARAPRKTDRRMQQSVIRALLQKLAQRVPVHGHPGLFRMGPG